MESELEKAYKQYTVRETKKKIVKESNKEVIDFLNIVYEERKARFFDLVKQFGLDAHLEFFIDFEMTKDAKLIKDQIDGRNLIISVAFIPAIIKSYDADKLPRKRAKITICFE